MNGDFRDGYCALPMSNTPQSRASAAICYLDAEVRRRPNLTILARATASEIVFDGRRAVGVKATVAGRAARIPSRAKSSCAAAASSRRRC